jgi:hypothetical protein
MFGLNFGRSFLGFLGISCKGSTKFRAPLDSHGGITTLSSSHSPISISGFSPLKLCSNSGGVGGFDLKVWVLPGKYFQSDVIPTQQEYWYN